jgi:hypothetical protein
MEVRTLPFEIQGVLEELTRELVSVTEHKRSQTDRGDLNPCDALEYVDLEQNSEVQECNEWHDEHHETIYHR